MATRNPEASAEKAYAAASADVPVTAPQATASKASVEVTPVVAAPAAKVATPVPAKPAKRAAKPVAAKRVAKPVAAKVKPVTAKVTAKAAPAKKAAVKVAKKATKTVRTAPVAAQRTVKSTLAAVTAAAPTETVLGFARKGQTMITETTTKMTEEATKFAQDAKVRGEAMIADMRARAETATVKGQEFVKEATEFSRGNVEAMVESAKIVGTGMQAMGQEFVAVAKASVEDTTAAAKRYAAVKTPSEFFALQTELTRASIDAMVKNGSKATEMSVKLANDAFQPISNRISVAMSKLKSAA
jgi:phasin family protein